MHSEWHHKVGSRNQKVLFDIVNGWRHHFGTSSINDEEHKLIDSQGDYLQSVFDCIPYEITSTLLTYIKATWRIIIIYLGSARIDDDKVILLLILPSMWENREPFCKTQNIVISANQATWETTGEFNSLEISFGGSQLSSNATPGNLLRLSLSFCVGRD